MGSTIIGTAEREEAIRLLAADGQERELKTQALTVIERAKAITITDQRSYDVACALLLGEIKPFRKRWESYWHGTDENPGPIKLAYKSYKSLLEKYNEADKPAEEAEKTVKAATVVWEQEQDRIKERLQREAQEKAEAEERERQLQAAVVAEQSGASEEEVEAIISAPLAIVAAPVASTFQRAVGIVSLAQTGNVWLLTSRSFARLLARAKSRSTMSSRTRRHSTREPGPTNQR